MHLEDAIDIQGLTVCYEEHPVLWNLDLKVPRSKLVAIVGPNGAGKSTLLKACVELIPCLAGQVRLLGKPLKEVRKKVCYVPQRESVDWDFPIDVEELVMMGRYAHMGWLSRPRPCDHACVEKALNDVSMLEFGKRQINQLSGGQQQRVFIARAIAQQASLYFMDEPFAAVDQATERQLALVLRQLTHSGASVFVVHHDLSTLKEYFDWVVLINRRLIASGPVEEVFTPSILQEAYGRVMIHPEISQS